jgi:ABC-type Mn2+/Zn2+ transport system permease subunit
MLVGLARHACVSNLACSISMSLVSGRTKMKMDTNIDHRHMSSFFATGGCIVYSINQLYESW